MRVEAKVGIFVVIGFALLLALSTQLNSVRNMGDEGYSVYAYVDTATGLKPQAKVQMSGVDIGRVDTIELVPGKVRLTLMVQKKFKIPVDSTISLLQESMLGSKIVSITSGTQNSFLQPQGSISKTSTLSSFEETSQKVSDAAEAFKTLMKSANNVLDQKRQDSLKDAIDDLRVTMRDIREMVKDNKELVHSTIKNYDKLALEFNKFGVELNRWVPTAEQKATNLLDTYSQAGDELSELITSNSKPLNKTIVSTGEFFDEGKKAVERIDRYLSSVIDSELKLSIYDRYLINDNSHKIFAGLKYSPEPSTSYFAEVVSDDDFTKTDDNSTTGNWVAPVLHEAGKYWVTILYGKRFTDLMFRIGLIESHGGIGVDYFMDHDRWKFSADFYDFGAKNDFRSQNMRVNLTAKYTYLEHVDFYIGLDNILNTTNTYTQDLDGVVGGATVSKTGNYNFVMGVGINFVDDHLKRVLSFTGIPSVK